MEQRWHIGEIVIGLPKILELWGHHVSERRIIPTPLGPMSFNDFVRQTGRVNSETRIVVRVAYPVVDTTTGEAVEIIEPALDSAAVRDLYARVGKPRAEIARRMRVSRRVISYWLRGQRRPTRRHARRFRQILLAMAVIQEAGDALTSQERKALLAGRLTVRLSDKLFSAEVGLSAETRDMLAKWGFTRHPRLAAGEYAQITAIVGREG